METLYKGDCLEILPTLPDSSVDLILTDPPYYKVKGDYWDRQWDNPQNFLRWLEDITIQYYRVLKPNGSLYMFASPQMSARVEVMIAARFNVLNNIRWVKEAGWHNKTDKEMIRSYLSPYESIVFAEHYGADGYAKGEAGYTAKVDELRGFVFEPIRAYLESERERAGISYKNLAEYVGVTPTMLGQHYFSRSQWAMPTKEMYIKMREGLSLLNGGGDYLKREYDDLKREYDDLKREYESLRRPFNVSADVPYTDVWTFKTVSYYKGKHPCEKPEPLIEHIIKASSNEGAVVLDSFMGTGNTGRVARRLKRDFIGIEKDEKYFEIARQRIEGQLL